MLFVIDSTSLRANTRRHQGVMAMAQPLKKGEAEMFMDEHTARLQATVDHIQSDVTETKGDIRRLDAKLDAQRVELSQKIDAPRSEFNTRIDAVRTDLTERIDALRTDLTERIDALRTDLTTRIDAVRVELTAGINSLRSESGAKFDALFTELKEHRKDITDLKVWRWVDRVWALVVGAAILSVMARAFKWI
jgi:DNA anti-recombination protein RmuC